MCLGFNYTFQAEPSPSLEGSLPENCGFPHTEVYRTTARQAAILFADCLFLLVVGHDRPRNGLSTTVYNRVVRSTDQRMSGNE